LFKKIIVVGLFLAISGCSNRSPDFFEAKSEHYYKLAEKYYLDALKSNGASEVLHLGLGKLYYSHGKFDLAIQELTRSNSDEAREILAFCYYKTGDYTKALAVFDRLKEPIDSEGLYFYGLTCEKLNLYERASVLYAKIKSQEFIKLAAQRLNLLNSQTDNMNIAAKDGKLFDLIGKYSQADFPQAGAIILIVDEAISVSADNTMESDSYIAAKILNERGKETFSEIPIEYDSTDEEVELVFARVIKPDGTIVTVGQKNIRDVSKYLNFPLYSNARVRIISMPEVAEGSVIEYKAKIKKHKLIDKDKFAVYYPVQEGDPILNCSFKIIVPKDKKIKVGYLNSAYIGPGMKLEPKISEEKDSFVYLWGFHNIPQLLPEANMVPESWVNPAIIVSRFNSWDEIYNWWWSLAKDKISANEEIKNKVLELTKGKLTDLDKARAIANFCIEKIRYVAVEYGQAGYEPHKAGDIFQNKYGDCKDQAILLVTMLKEAGIKAWPVIIGTKDLPEIPIGFPTLLFNHVICAFESKDEIIFIDPTAETCSFGDLPDGDQDRFVLLIEDSGLKLTRTPIFDSVKNRLELRSRIKVNPDETIKASKEIFSFGQFDQGQRYWLKYTPPELVKETLQGKIQDTSVSAKLLNYRVENLDDLSSLIKLNYDFEGEHYLTKSANARILPALSHVDTSIVAKPERRYPIDLGLPSVNEMYFSIEIPANFKIKYMPDNVSVATKWFSFENKYEVKGNTINFYEKRVNKEKSVSLKDYLDFKNALESLAKAVDQRVIIEVFHEENKK